MKSVRDILDSKGYGVWSISESASVFEALEEMAEKNVGALVVTDGGRVVGLISERDYARKVILKGKTSRQLDVGDIMTHELVSVPADRTVDDCMRLMTERHIRHLPVFEDERLVGIISIGDVVKTLIEDQRHLIDELECYIAGVFH